MNTVPNKSESTTSANGSMFGDLDRRKRFSCFSCQSLGCAFILVVGLLVGGVLTAVASTGLIQLPILSALVYSTPPAPTRVVTAEPFQLDQTLQSVAPSADGTAVLAISEAQLTSFVAADQLPSFRQAQIAVSPGELEFYGYYIDVPVGDPVLIRATLTVPEAGGCSVRSLSVGRLTVPMGFAASPGQSLCQELVASARFEPFQIESLTAGSGSLTVMLRAGSAPSSEPTE